MQNSISLPAFPRSPPHGGGGEGWEERGAGGGGMLEKNCRVTLKNKMGYQVNKYWVALFSPNTSLRRK